MEKTRKAWGTLCINHVGQRIRNDLHAFYCGSAKFLLRQKDG
jgi:hypothetical protein